jgi:hypothetical protein
MAVSKKRIAAGVAVAGLAAVGAVALGTSAFADPTASASESAGATPASGKADHQRGNGQAPQHTAVTGDAAQKVKDAIAAKFSGVTITGVTADGDGSYDADGTKADGTSVRYEVSLDLATITEGTGGRGKGGPGGQGGASQDTAVTGDEATKVKDAVVAKNAGVTITEVRKDPDGSYDALGTSADGTKVMYDVSTDLATITQGGKG